MSALNRSKFTLRLLALTWLRCALPLLAVAASCPLQAQAPVATANNVTPDQAQKLLQDQPKTLILDVRTPEEFAQGHLSGAINISSADPQFNQKIAALSQSFPVLLHCAAGGRSSRVLPQIEALKFPAIFHLNGGFNAWLQAGKPIDKPKQP